MTHDDLPQSSGTSQNPFIMDIEKRAAEKKKFLTEKSNKELISMYYEKKKIFDIFAIASAK